MELAIGGEGLVADMRWSTEVVAVDRCDLSVSFSRGDGPVVVILHGQLGVASVFQAFGNALSGATVAIPDLRGRGQSVCYDESAYTWARLAGDVVDVLDHLDAPSAVLAGASMGAGLAVATALLHPDRVDALALHALPYAGWNAGWLNEQLPLMRSTLEFAREVRDRSLEAAINSRSEQDPTTDVSSLRARWTRHDPSSIAAALLGLGWTQPFGDIQDLRALAVPTGVCPGTDNLHPRSIGEECLTVINDAQSIGDAPADLATFVNALAR